ncbi:cache domain-containing sensor histidine kinase [Paenibacillus terrigena]|uniref:cache domain-containing sensor histidine kinase n=1 Tax=Paenibacillus terrigena TaxID=369333 RepID=UPI0003820E16|nr:sensor histidine kinase [Paenibacillus terrigena]
MFKQKDREITMHFIRTFVLIIIIPFIIFINIFYKYYSTSLIHKSIDQMVQQLDAASNNMNSELKRASLTISTIANVNDHTILDAVSAWSRSSSSVEKIQLTREIDAYLNIISNYSNEIVSVIFTLKDGGYYYFKNPPTISDSSIRNLPWYQETLRNSNGTAVIVDSLNGITSDKQDMFTLLLHPDQSLETEVEMVYLITHASLPDYIHKNPDIEQFMIDRNGNRIVNQNNHDKVDPEILMELSKMLKKPTHNRDEDYTFININGANKLIKLYSFEKSGWSIVNILDENIVTRDANQFLKISIIFIFGSFALFLLFLLSFFKDILRPLQNLIRAMRRVETGDFFTEVKADGRGEIKRLGYSFNRMVSQIRDLMQERDLKERARSQAEIEALQSQINPHFLSNTLNSVRLMAMIAKTDNIRKIIESLSALLTHVFRAPNSLAPIGQEIKVLESYVHIMQVRYGGKLNIQFDIDDTLLNYSMPKMLLQPILENAIFHGLDQQQMNELIEVKAVRHELGVCFTITDYGKGMTDEQIRGLLQQGEKYQRGNFSGIGVHNVLQRIELNYGHPYGVEIDSQLGRGTIITILLPLILT